VAAALSIFWRGLFWLRGGKSIIDALEDAESALEEGRDDALNLLRLKLDELHALSRRSPDRPEAAEIQKLYQLSGDILDAAGTYGMPELSPRSISFESIVAFAQTTRGQLGLVRH